MFDIGVLAYNIKTHREMKGISQKELAEKLFVSAQAISKWERGVAVPEIDKLCMLAEILGCRIDALVGHFEDRETVMIGVDGGGTKTEYIMFNEHGKIFKRIVGEATNPNFYGIENVCEKLKNTIKTLLAMKPNVKGIFVGGAGYLTGDNSEQIKIYLRNAFPTIKVRCASDMLNVIACATDAEMGLGTISGTGNVTFAYKNDKIIKYGGYGVLFDKAGSGYDIGREALFAAFQESEGIGEETLITELVKQRIETDDIIKHIRDFYDKDVSYIASFATTVFEAWEKGDKIASQIISENVERIAYLINSAYDKNKECKTLALAGSLYKNKEFRDAVRAKLNPDIECIVSDNPPVLGACVLCCRLMGIDASKVRENFRHEYKEKLGIE